MFLLSVFASMSYFLWYTLVPTILVHLVLSICTTTRMGISLCCCTCREIEDKSTFYKKSFTNGSCLLHQQKHRQFDVLVFIIDTILLGSSSLSDYRHKTSFWSVL
jgi:hypothetical protein